MGTYIPMAENQRDEETTQILAGNIMYMNFSSSSSGQYSDTLPANSDHFQPSDSNPSRQVLLSFGGSPNMQQGQGLSLSLGTHMQQIQYHNENPDFSSMLGCNNTMLSSEAHLINSDNVGLSNVARNLPNSKYLKAAQELLDQVVNVRQAMNVRKESGKEVEGEYGDGENDGSLGKVAGNSSSELSVVEKHELQNKLTKLLAMFDEVDRRYRQYYHQMQIVVCSFDVVAGSGASKPYTALALQTISRHFRCLRDAINGQIHAARKSLGEEDGSLNNKGVGISRLRFVDQQLRQQRALQQLGMMQPHAWRPQRGLPETSVSILRAWLFEHFLHPYPKDSDKIMLARQTGLTRSQVSNWFINARVRLWKPMVEEMYKEETGDADMDSNSSSETVPRTAAEKTSNEKADDIQPNEHLFGSKSDQMTNTEMMNMMQAESQANYGMGETGDRQRQNPFPNGTLESSSGNDRIMAAYHMPELERFGHVSGGVSLTLGLQQCEGSHHGFVPIRDADVYNATGSDMSNETGEFECMDSGNRPHQFVSSLLPSFS